MKELSETEKVPFLTKPLPEGSQIFLVDDNPEFNLKAGWSNFDYFGNPVQHSAIDSITPRYRIPV